ncbi:MAG TPA: hypothetical protein VMH81_31570 [Bryobacteraceae bacterium]|nr:hypothetical protein [Bryobacteraceae bacterium]
MFTWICPQCGREVPPSYNECPDCAKPADQAGNLAGQPAAEQPVAAPPAYQPADYPPPAYPPQPPAQPAPAYPSPAGPPSQVYTQPQAGYYPPPQAGYPPNYPPQQGYPPYPPPQGYPQQGYPPQQPPYPPQPSYPQAYAPPQQGYAPPSQTYPPPQPAYPPPPSSQPAYPPPPARPPAEPAPPAADTQSSRPPRPASFLGLSGGPLITTAPPPAKDAPGPPPSPAAISPVSPRDLPSAFSEPAPPARGGLPTWLLTIIFVVILFGVVGGAYWFVNSSHGSSAQSPSANVENPAAKPGAKLSPYLKIVEITGVRFDEDARKKPIVRFVIVNHSNAAIDTLAGNVTIWGRTRSSEEDAYGTFTFKTSLKPNEAKDVTSPLETKKKIYELPDWQNVSTDVQITEPASGG